MTTEHFHILLNDLYDIYNSGKKADISSLLEKYNGQEYEAVYQILFKYNYPRNPLYNPDVTSPKFVKLLIDTYSNNKRLLKDPDFLIKNYNQNIKFEGIVEEKVSTVRNEITKDLENRIEESLKNNVILIDEIKKNFEIKILELEKEIQSYRNNLPEILKNATINDNDNIEIKLNILWTEHEINLPSNLKYCTAGDRIITTDNNNNIIGLEIKDIYWDCISLPNKIVKEITIDKITNNF